MPKTNRKKRLINKNTLKKRFKNKRIKRGGSLSGTLMQTDNLINPTTALSQLFTSVLTNTEDMKDAISSIEIMPNISKIILDKLITTKNVTAVGGCILGLGIIGGIAGYTGVKTYDGIRYAEHYLRNIKVDKETNTGMETCDALYKITNHANIYLGEIICGGESAPKELIELFENMKDNQKKLETFICSLRKK